MHADVSRSGRSTGNRVEQLQAAGAAVDGERIDGSFFFVADAVGFVGRIEVGPGFIEREAAWASALFVNIKWSECARSAVDFKYVNPVAVARGKINLGRQHIVKWRAESADVGDQRRLFGCGE